MRALDLGVGAVIGDEDGADAAGRPMLVSGILGWAGGVLPMSPVASALLLGSGALEELALLPEKPPLAMPPEPKENREDASLRQEAPYAWKRESLDDAPWAGS